MLALLKKLSEEFNVAVVLTNQVWWLRCG
jgi:hypothetical protein